MAACCVTEARAHLYIHCGSKLAGGRLPAFHQWDCQKLLQWGHAEHSKKQAVVPTEISKKLPSMTLWAIPREMLPYGCAELPGKTFHGETITSEMPQLEWNSPLRILNHVVEGHARSLESGRKRLASSGPCRAACGWNCYLPWKKCPWNIIAGMKGQGAGQQPFDGGHRPFLCLLSLWTSLFSSNKMLLTFEEVKLSSLLHARQWGASAVVISRAGYRHVSLNLAMLPLNNL